MAFLSNATVNTLYFVLLALGMIYAIFLIVAGQIGGDGGDFDLDVDGDVDLGADGGDHSGGLSPLSPLTISSFVTAFGASGLVATSLLGASDRASIGWATLGGVVFSALAYFSFTFFLIKPQGSSEVRLATLAGKIAEVITPIPASGMGEIAFVAQGGRMTFSARSTSNKEIKRGAPVRITRIVGGVAYVELYTDV